MIRYNDSLNQLINNRIIFITTENREYNVDESILSHSDRIRQMYDIQKSLSLDGTIKIRLDINNTIMDIILSILNDKLTSIIDNINLLDLYGVIEASHNFSITELYNLSTQKLKEIIEMSVNDFDCKYERDVQSI